MVEKWGSVPLLRGELYPHLTQCHLGRDLGHNVWAEIGGGAAAPHFWGGGAGSPFITMSHGPRPTSIQSGILVHLAV